MLVLGAYRVLILQDDMANNASKKSGQNGSGKGLVNVAIAPELHSDLAKIQLFLADEFPSLRDAVGAAVKDFRDKHLPRALKRAQKQMSA